MQNPRPWEISRASGDVFPNTSLLSAVYGYNIAQLNLFIPGARKAKYVSSGSKKLIAEDVQLQVKTEGEGEHWHWQAIWLPRFY